MTHLIRFVAAETSQVHLGQPVDASLDGASSLFHDIRHKIVGSALHLAAHVSKTVLTGEAAVEPGLKGGGQKEASRSLCQASTALIGPCATGIIPRAAQPVKEHIPDYEVGRPAKDVSESDALDYVLGYTTANDKLPLKTTLNGTVVQDGNTADQTRYSPSAFLSQATTLEPGSVILTGTPKGVGFVKKPPVYLKHGDTMSVWFGAGLGH
ncbi:hypothetical protein K438DRAFT_1962122 [Mycena galopus ATCC 62051]|nr:hypothetical protein K438DRAFT_1962122 [Mycena galopus ATCC 62051]